SHLFIVLFYKSRFSQVVLVFTITLERLFPGGSQYCSSHSQYPGKVFFGQFPVFLVYKSGISVADTDHPHIVFYNSCFSDPAYCSVKAGAITTCGQYPYLLSVTYFTHLKKLQSTNLTLFV